MQVIDGVDAIKDSARGAVVAAGAFDGVHVGHQAVLRRLVQEANERRAPAVVVSWDPPGPTAIADLAQRTALLDGLGVEILCLIDGPEDVVPAVGSLGPALIVSGPMAATVVPEVEWVDAVADSAGRPVTSDAVRVALAAGAVDEARRLLGRYPSLVGVVERGDARGRDLGFRTANVAVAGHLAIPADGVYGGRYRRPDGTDFTDFTAAISVGRRPTFYDESGLRLVEAYLLDFEGDLYGEDAEVFFESWIRGQERFEDIDELVAQIDRDVSEVRARAAATG